MNMQNVRSNSSIAGWPRGEGGNYNYLTEHFRKHFETPVKPKLADANYVFIARKFSMRLVTNKSLARC